MKDNILIDKETNNVTINIPYTLTYRLSELDKILDHVNLAKALKEKDLGICMVIIESEFLADGHWDDPAFMHKTNNLMVCEAHEEARKEINYKYLRDAELEEFIKNEELPTWRYNYQDESKEKNGRIFKFEVQDAIFEYQEMRELVQIMERRLQDAGKYLLDEGGYIIHEDDAKYIEGLGEVGEVVFDEDGYAVVTDPEVIAKQRELVLRRMLKPRVNTKHERVYDMPDPFCHWDSRSSWHQFFIVTDKKNNEVLINRGCSGSSGAREENGRWSHAFAYLSKEYGVETPTFHLKYDEHNQLKFVKKYDEFKTLPYDLCGNYQVDNYRAVDALFEGKKIKSILIDRWCKEI